MASPATLDSIAAQVAAVSLKMDAAAAREEERDKRISSVELVAAAVLQALTTQQMPMLGTIIEKLDKLQEAATDKKAGGELAAAMEKVASTMNELTGSNHELVKAVREFPEMVILAAGDGIDLPDAPRAPPPEPAPETPPG